MLCCVFNRDSNGLNDSTDWSAYTVYIYIYMIKNKYYPFYMTHIVHSLTGIYIVSFVYLEE